MAKINLLPLIDREEKAFNSFYTDLEVSYITIEKNQLAEKTDNYYQFLDNIRQLAYKGSNKRVLKLLLIAKVIRKKQFNN
jgi:hypothetical protein